MGAGHSPITATERVVTPLSVQVGLPPTLFGFEVEFVIEGEEF